MSKRSHPPSAKTKVGAPAAAATTSATTSAKARQTSSAPAGRGYSGQPASRVDGRAKVTGAARYAAEFSAPGLVYGRAVPSAIAKGRIVSIDASAALALPGVLQVFSHENVHGLAWFDHSYRDQVAPMNSPLRPLQDDKLHFCGQPVALVVAESLELADYAASLIRVEYAPKEAQLDFEKAQTQAYEAPHSRPGIPPPPKPRGDAEAALAAAEFTVDAHYGTPTEHHNPMETFAATAIWEADGTLTVYDKTQGVLNTKQYLSHVFKLDPDSFNVVSPFVGGAFGSALRPQYSVFMAVLAARELKLPVRVELTRRQMFTLTHRPRSLQHLQLGADREGRLQAVIHEAISETSHFEDYIEAIVNWSGLLYQCDNVKLSHKLSQLDVYTPGDMRAPGATSGVYALECAIDELAHAVGLDPLELRLRNYAELDQNKGLPFSSKALRECYALGAERFGWEQRPLAPRSQRQGDKLIGQGMATGVWDAFFQKASARAELGLDGRLTISAASADIGTGTYTILAQIAAEALGLPLAAVSVKLGDSRLPTSPIEGGSWTAASVGSAVKQTCEALIAKLLELAKKQYPDFKRAKPEDVTCVDGWLELKSAPGGVSLINLMRQGGVYHLEATGSSQPNPADLKKYSFHTHSAVFAEVEVDEELGTVLVTRMVSAIAGGRILNPKTARSQILGGMVWGIGMALEEETHADFKLGRYVNTDFAGYHIPVHADIRQLEVIFAPERDDKVNPLGVKGLGEIGIVGVAAAIANAVFHATGKRVRALPITVEKLL